MKPVQKFWKAEYYVPVLLELYDRVPARFKALPVADRISRGRLIEHFFTDMPYRTRLLLFPSLAVNLLHTAVQLILSVAFHSIWSGALAVYYAMLAVMRAQLLKPVRRSSGEDPRITELRRYRLCGVLLLCMTPVLASIMILVVHKNGGASYPGVTIAIMALYVLYVSAAAVSSLIQLKKYRRPAVSAAKIVSLTAMLMSVMFFVTALAARIGDESFSFARQCLIGTASGAVCVIVLGMAVYMLVHGSRLFKAILKETKNIYEGAPLFQIHLTKGI